MTGDEFGLVGGIPVMALLLPLILGGMLMALRARNRFSRLLAFGVSMNFLLYCAADLSMVTGAPLVGGVPLLLWVHVHRDLCLDASP